MARPYVQAAGENLLDEYLRELERALPMLKALPGVVGITLNGGLSRGFGDGLSEIDITLYLSEAGMRAFSMTRQPIALGITKLNGYLYDIKAVLYSSEREREWDMVAKWDASYARVLYDPEGKIERMLREQLLERPKSTDAGGYMFSAWWYYKLAGDIWLSRGDAIQGHMMLNMAVPPLLTALFVLNGEYAPHEKWLIHMSRSLEWTPDNFEARLEDITIARECTLKSVALRQRAIDAMWHDIDLKLCEGMDAPLPLAQLGAYAKLVKAFDKGVYTLDEFAEAFGLEELNSEPMHALARVEGDLIYIDRDAAANLDETRLYSWFLEAVRAAL